MIEVRKLWELKHKARLELEHSAFLLGVRDETHTLGVDEVFCQVWAPGSIEPKIITGDCILYRSPAMHPGDADASEQWIRHVSDTSRMSSSSTSLVNATFRIC